MNTTTTIPMSTVRAVYERLSNRGHWFEPSTMRFFESRLGRVAYVGPAGAYFVTSERNPSGVRAYSVRRWDGGDIDTVGEFHALGRATAHRRARECAASAS